MTSSSTEPAPTPSSSASSSSSDDDLRAEIADLRERFAALDEKTTKGQLTLQDTDAELAAKVDQLRGDFEKWPQRGGMGEDVGQPWDLKSHGLPAPGETRDYLPGGEADQISPVVVAHNKPILAPGMAGTAVAELAGLLKKVGYDTSISKGINHALSFDDTIASAVAMFKREFHVHEDPSQFPPGTDHDRFVGPWIWEAAIRAAKLAEKVL